MDQETSQREPARALIVDDERFMRVTLRDMLEASGYAVLEAASGPEALQMVRQEPPDFILLDIVMPGMDGFETCAELRRLPESRHLPILMVTSLEDGETIKVPARYRNPAYTAWHRHLGCSGKSIISCSGS
jgi:CheY-like chemotaxis protein